MKIKANLHFHTSDDPEDVIDYSFYEGIDRAAALGFDVIALTCHNRFIANADYESYARERNILIIRGIERSIEGKHVLILNGDDVSGKIETFSELARYKENNPAIFIIAPHPYFLAPYSLGKKLDEHASVFDAIEHSWFYSKSIDLNRKAEHLAKAKNLPLVAASDTHNLKFLDRSYVIIDATEKTPAALFEAIREKKFKNVTAPSKFWREMIYYFALGEIKKYLAGP